MIPADSFIQTIRANVDNHKLGDAKFRQFIRNTLPIVGYFKVSEEQAKQLKYEALSGAAESAAQWLCDAPPHTDQWERGNALRKALNAIRKST